MLQQWTVGGEDALDKLIPPVYAELRRLAASYLRRERRDHTLQATALVHEAFLRLVDQRDVRWQNRAHFFGIAAQLMRRILVDHARAHAASKRGDGVRPAPGQPGRTEWVAMLEPRYVLERARLFDEMRQPAAAAAEYTRFLQLWTGADGHLPELAEARRALVRLGPSARR